jgi:hypothetical protein
MANRTLLFSATASAGLAALLLGPAPSVAAGPPMVVFTTSCSANQATPTLNNVCTGTNPTQTNPSFGLAPVAGANKNPNQKFAVDLETPTDTIPASTRPRYGMRYLFRPGTPDSPATGGRTQTVTGDAGHNLLTGVDYTTNTLTTSNGGNNTLRVNYWDFPGTSVTTDGTNFTRPLQLGLTRFALGGTCAICGSSNPIYDVEPIYATGTWVGDGGYNDGTGVYSIKSRRTAVKIGTNRSGSIIFDGSVSIANGIVTDTTGTVTLILTVPAPLPILGGGIAFGWSRRMRRRVALRAA